MKKVLIFTVALLVTLMCNVCFARNDVYVASYKSKEFYVDTDSISGDSDFFQVTVAEVDTRTNRKERPTNIFKTYSNGVVFWRWVSYDTGGFGSDEMSSYINSQSGWPWLVYQKCLEYLE